MPDYLHKHFRNKPLKLVKQLDSSPMYRCGNRGPEKSKDLLKAIQAVHGGTWLAVFVRRFFRSLHPEWTRTCFLIPSESVLTSGAHDHMS